MNLAHVRSEIMKLQEIAAERARRGARPLTVHVLPENARGGPKVDTNEPLPHVIWRTEGAVCVVFDPAVGQPSREEIARLVEAQP